MTEENVLNPVNPDAVSEAVSEASAEIAEAAGTIAEEVSEAVSEAAGEVSEAVESASEAAEEAAANVADETAETVVEAVTESAKNEAIDEITETAEEVTKSVTEEVSEAAGSITEAVDEAKETVGEAAEAVDEATEVAVKAADAAEDVVTKAGDAAEELLAETVATVADDDKLDELIDEAVTTDKEEPASEEAEKAEENEAPEAVEAGREAEPPVILFKNVHKEYEGQIEDSVALVDVSFEIQKGEFVFIVGPSGSGKSTMIRLMMREISPSGGNIYIAGKDLAKLRRRQVSKYRRNIGIVFQDFRLLPDRNVYDNVAFAQRVVGAPKRDIPKEVSKVLHLVGLSQKYKSFPNELSGGEQQRVAIARALVNNPMIILADEPTGNLDPQNSYEIMSLLEEINRRGTTVVIVTHDREVVDQMQKRVVTLQDGVIVEDKKGGYIYG
ncbi:MAG: cell division ATP-binding protein FtsE [Lachnospiraceae bacterium]|nr:cell division ATP-binding protein FtsE [Lachnospiraceae bacterium]